MQENRAAAAERQLLNGAEPSAPTPPPPLTIAYTDHVRALELLRAELTSATLSPSATCGPECPCYAELDSLKATVEQQAQELERFRTAETVPPKSSEGDEPAEAVAVEATATEGEQPSTSDEPAQGKPKGKSKSK